MTSSTDISREELDRTPGLLLVEFGAGWCPICQAFAPELAKLLKQYPMVPHLKIEDGKGKRLGRSYRVKLWPTLVFLKDGKIEHQLVRPSPAEAEEAFRALTGG